MSLKTKISKAEFEKLSDELKKEYIPDGENYKLDADYEDVTGLKGKNAELLGKLKDAEKLAKEFEGLDPAEVKTKLAALAEQETADAVAKGKWEELEKNLRDRHQKELEAANARITAIFGASAEKDLQLALVAAGVKENLAEDLAISLRARHIKPVEDGGKAIWKTLDDTETVDLAKFIPSLKENGKADYFKSDLGSGSGASGSDGKGDSAKTMPKTQFDAMDVKAQAAFINSGGKPVE